MECRVLKIQRCDEKRSGDLMVSEKSHSDAQTRAFVWHLGANRADETVLQLDVLESLPDRFHVAANQHGLLNTEM